jgi:hypothetical protein
MKCPGDSHRVPPSIEYHRMSAGPIMGLLVLPRRLQIGPKMGARKGGAKVIRHRVSMSDIKLHPVTRHTDQPPSLVELTTVSKQQNA